MKKVCLIIFIAVFVSVMTFSVIACTGYPIIEKRSGCSINFDIGNYHNISAINEILSDRTSCQVDSVDVPILRTFIMNGYSVKEQNDEEYASFLSNLKIQNEKAACGDYIVAVHRNAKWTGYILGDKPGINCSLNNCLIEEYTIVWNDLIVNTTNVTNTTIKKIESIKDYRATINLSCQYDNDCEVKDVRNCCGASLECINKNSVFNSSIVEELCKNDKSNAVCGSVKINYCKCVNNFCRGFLSSVVQCPSVEAPSCIAELVDQGVDDKGCRKIPLCMKKLSNGKNAEIKVLPETASKTAVDRLGELGFNVTLKEVGSGDSAKPVYEYSAEKDAKILGFISAKAKVSVEIDAVSGEIIKVDKPWWSSLAGI